MHDYPEFEDSSEINKIEILQQDSKETMMNMIYNTVINDEKSAIEANTPTEQKVEALTNIIDFFIKSEEYEKCHNIKNIIKKIQC